MDARIWPLYRVIRNTGASFLIFAILGLSFLISGAFPYQYFIVLSLEQRLIALMRGRIGVFLFVFFFTLLAILRDLNSLNSLTKYKSINYGIKIFAGSVILTTLSLVLMGVLTFYVGGIFQEIAYVVVIVSLVVGFLFAISSQILISHGLIRFGEDEKNEILKKGPFISIFSIAGIVIILLFLLYLDYLYYTVGGQYIPYGGSYEAFMMMKYLLLIYFISSALIGYGFLDLAYRIRKIGKKDVVDKLIVMVRETDYSDLREFSEREGIPLIMAMVLKKLAHRI
ncbi:MAG: hypothetical protein ACP6IP_08970 [Candidatus Njordarchaeia archaeon]